MSLFLAAGGWAVGTAALAPTGRAEAHLRSYSTAQCWIDTNNIGGNYRWDYGIGGINNYSQGPDNLATCPIPDDTSFPKTLISVINVVGFDNNNSDGFSAYVCQTSNVTTSVQCSASTALSGSASTGVFHSQLSSSSSAVMLLDDTSKSDWYAELVISIPYRNSGDPYGSAVGGYDIE